jgi:hypothetical protein
VPLPLPWLKRLDHGLRKVGLRQGWIGSPKRIMWIPVNTVANRSISISLEEELLAQLDAQGSNRERFGLGPSTRLEWIVDGDGAIMVVPVDLDPIRAYGCAAVGCSTAPLSSPCGTTRTAPNGWPSCFNRPKTVKAAAWSAS